MTCTFTLSPKWGCDKLSESVLPVACPNTKVDPECELSNLWLVLMQDQVAKYVVPLPSLIPEHSTRPFHPLVVLEVGSSTKFQLLSHCNIVGPSLGLTRNLGMRHVVSELWLSSNQFLGVLDDT